MYGPDPNTIMAYARMLAAEQERVERRRSQRPRYDDASERLATQPRAVPDGRLGALLALLNRPGALRWHGRL
jgi:hypothetical protein